jgi:hypothetical protein
MKTTEFDSSKNDPLYEYRVAPKVMAELQQLALRELFDKNASETKVDSFLKKNPLFLANAMNFTSFGHHASYVIPQINIRPSNPHQKGLKPDYVIGGKNSNGFEWYVIELKGVSDNLFVKRNKGKDIQLSATANKGICQLLRYIDFCAENQTNMRDSLKLANFREPKGFLIIGRENEFEDEDLQKMKRAFNYMFAGRIEIRTYDALLRSHGGTWAETGSMICERSN